MEKHVSLSALSILACLGCLMSTSAHAYQMTVQTGSSNDGSPGNPTGTTVSSPGPAVITGVSAAISGTDASNPLFPRSGSASAAVDLKAGSVTAAATSNAGNTFGIAYTGFANGYALLSETLTFSQPGASVGIFARLAGSADITDPAASYDNSYNATFSSGTNSGVFSHTATVASGGATIADSALLNGAAWVGATVNGIDANNVDFMGYLIVDKLSSTMTIQELISLDAFGAMNSAFGYLNLVLPAGVSFTSTSGVFLSNPIPEPGSFALLASALIGLGCVSLRRARD